jgi:oligopeptidase B
MLFQVYQETILGFDPSAYSSQLEWASSADGTRVPITVAYRADLLRGDGSNKAVLHA